MLAQLLLSCLLLLLVAYIRRRREMRAFDPAIAQPLPAHLHVDAVEAFLERREAAVAPLRPGTRSTVTWEPSARHQQARLCVVFLHGWSASPEEIDPVDAEVASKLGAHLLRYRLTGHGLSPTERSALAMRDEARSRVLRTDASTALALGRLLGQRVVVIGCSTGGSLAMWLAAQPWARESLAAIVLISPAWQVAKFGTWMYNLLKWPLILAPRPIARNLMHALAGPTIRHNVNLSVEKEHARVWTHKYPSDCALNAIEIYCAVDVCLDCRTVQVPVLAFANPSDKTVCFHATKRKIRRMPAAVLEIINGSENSHVITGRLKSPSTVPYFTARIIDFVTASTQKV
ncbi:hypothetical protein AB1Y20_020261 [Prymnesium parvum]|uniref:AB hydrolase-1 domain-containing protein n=1 Tax=Prymnesium parvum TaxID=97485 RepID=A0AB34JWW7_PRYPA